MYRALLSFTKVGGTAAHQQGAPQVDAGFYGDVVRGLQEGPLQHQSEEEEHGEHRGVLQQLGGGHEVHAEVFVLQPNTHTHTKDVRPLLIGWGRQELQFLQMATRGSRREILELSTVFVSMWGSTSIRQIFIILIVSTSSLYFLYLCLLYHIFFWIFSIFYLCLL